MSLALALAAFCLTTFAAILIMLATSAPQHVPDYALSYRRFGLPAGIAFGVLSLAYLGTLWVRRMLRRA